MGKEVMGIQDRRKVSVAADRISEAVDLLSDAGLSRLSTAAQELLDRIEAVLDGDSPIVGDDE